MGVTRGWTLHEVDSCVVGDVLNGAYERERRRTQFDCDFRSELDRQARIVKRISLEDGIVIYEAKSMDRNKVLLVVRVALAAIVTIISIGWLLQSFYHYQTCPVGTSYVMQADTCVLSIRPWRE